jgi:hypothetical protein
MALLLRLSSERLLVAAFLNVDPNACNSWWLFIYVIDFVMSENQTVSLRKGKQILIGSQNQT